MADRPLAGNCNCLINILWIVALTAAFLTPVAGEEFCTGEAFQASCEEDEVVVMKSAVYGRMRLGRCVSRDLGYLGCQTDVLDRMHQLCSGKQSCEVPYVVGVLTDENACPKDFNSYLEANYTCVKVMNPKKSGCEVLLKGEHFPLARGYLSNHDTRDPGACGSASHPIIIQVASSQKIGFSLIDFSSPSGLPSGSTCVKLGSISGSSGTQDICGGKEDDEWVLTASGTRIEVRLMNPSENSGHHFLLGYTVVGCPEPNYPKDMWIRRDTGQVTIGCYSSRDTWRLTCVNNTWHGRGGNCTEKKLTHVRNEAWTEAPVEEHIDVFIPDEPWVISSELAMVIAITGGVLFSLLLLAVGLLFDKSKRVQKPQRSSPHAPSTMKRSPGGTTVHQNGVSIHKKSNGHKYVGNGIDTVGSSASCTTCPEYDVPHYYELDPNYTDGLVFDPNENIRQPLVCPQYPRSDIR